MYDFDGDYETVYTGETDVTKSGTIDTYRGSTHLPQWEGRCGYVQGSSDGTKFPSHIKENDTLSFFRKSMCRAKTLVSASRLLKNKLKLIVIYRLKLTKLSRMDFLPMYTISKTMQTTMDI